MKRNSVLLTEEHQLSFETMEAMKKWHAICFKYQKKRIAN